MQTRRLFTLTSSISCHSTVFHMTSLSRSSNISHKPQKSNHILYCRTHQYYGRQLHRFSMQTRGCLSSSEGLPSRKRNTSNLRWQHLHDADHPRIRQTCRNDSNFKACSAISSLVHRQSRSSPAISSDIGNCTERNDVDIRPASTSIEQLQNRVPEQSIPSERRSQDLCKWAPDSEPRNTDREDLNSVIASESWSDLPSQDRISPTVEASLDTTETCNPEARRLDPGDEFSAVLGEVARTAVDAFLAAERTSKNGSTKSNQYHCLKRSKAEPCKEVTNAAVHSDSEEGDIVLVEQPLEAEPQIWPCPFFVKDRISYLTCLTRHCLLSISDVREHLSLMHRIPIYCSVCYETFTTIRLRDIHMRHSQCISRLPVEFDGITYLQMCELEDQEETNGEAPALQQEQWYKVWRTVFPKLHPPPSPLLFSNHEFKVYEVRRFWKKFGEDIISDVLTARGLQKYSIGNEGRNLEALYFLVADRAADEVFMDSHEGDCGQSKTS